MSGTALVITVVGLTLLAWASIVWAIQASAPAPTCYWCGRGFPIGGWRDYPNDHAIEGWDGEVRFERCANPRLAIDHETWKQRGAA